MNGQDDFFIELAARLDTLIADQSRLLEVLRDKKARLVRVDRGIPNKPSRPRRQINKGGQILELLRGRFLPPRNTFRSLKGLILVLLFANTAFADFSGPVVGVLDGDTIDVLHDQRAERIRLNGIDCPEKGQAYGKKAKQAASDLIFGREVLLQTHGLDKYGRTIADVSLPNGTNLNLELVRNGWCWWYPKYAPDNVILAELQRRARRSGLGLWAEPDPVPPWEWRKLVGPTRGVK